MLRNQKQLKTSKELNAQGKTPGEAMELDLTNAKEEKVVTVVINRVTKVVKGGKRFSFNALVVVGGVRAVLEAGGVKNILTKNLGTRNAFNTVYATLDALKRLKSKEEVMKIRGKE